MENKSSTHNTTTYGAIYERHTYYCRRGTTQY